MAWRFYTTIKGQIVTFSEKWKAIKVGNVIVIDQEAIYARVIGLMVSQRELDLNEVIDCELAAYHASVFHPDGSMRTATGKAWLKKILAVETSTLIWGHLSKLVVDVSAVLWKIYWHTKGTVLTFVNSFKKWSSNQLDKAEVYLVLDSYYDHSTKSSTRAARADKMNHTRVHKLTANTPLTPRDAVLKCIANKVELNRIIWELILNDEEFHNNVTSDNCLFMTDVDLVPTVVHKGKIPRGFNCCQIMRRQT